MNEQERKRLGNWSTQLPVKYNPIRKCLVNLWKNYKDIPNITVKRLLELVEECIKDKGGDTGDQLKKIGMYKGEYQEIQDIEEEKQIKDNKIPHKPPKR